MIKEDKNERVGEIERYEVRKSMNKKRVRKLGNVRKWMNK